MTPREFLSRPFELNRELRIKTRQLESVNTIIHGTSITLSNIPCSHDPYRLESLMAKALDLEIEIDKITAEFTQAVKEVSDAINAINNQACEEVLILRYLGFRDWTTIARDLNYSKDWLYRLHRKGLGLIRF